MSSKKFCRRALKVLPDGLERRGIGRRLRHGSQRHGGEKHGPLRPLRWSLLQTLTADSQGGVRQETRAVPVL